MKQTIAFLTCLLCLTGLTAAQTQEKTSFCFAQITDTHITRRNPAKTEDLLRSVAQINATDGIDFVLVTGDLSNEGDSIGLAMTKQCLDLLKAPYYVVPGNHETKWSESGCTDFKAIYGYEHFSFLHKGIRFIGFNTGAKLRMADGHVDPQELRWLKEELKKTGTETPVILVTHYPVRENDVDNWSEVIDAILPYNIRLFVGGHYHRNMALSYDGIPGILLRSNQRQKKLAPGYGIYRIGNDSIKAYTREIGNPEMPLAAYSLSHNYHDRNGHAGSYPDSSANQKYRQVREVWKLRTGQAIYGSPASDGKRVFVGDDKGCLTAYRWKNGKQLWSYQCQGPIVGTPAVSDGVVVFGSADRHIYALDSEDGSLLWKIRTARPVLGAVTIDGEVVYIGSSEPAFRAIDLHTGKVLWTYRDLENYVESKPLIADNKVIFTAWDNTVYALGKADGQLVWKWNTGIKHPFYSPAAVWPTAAQGKCFIVDPRRVFTAIDLQNGKTMYETDASQVREAAGLSPDGLRFYAKTMADSVVCFDTRSCEPRRLWATDLDYGNEFYPAMPVEHDHTVYITTKRGMLYGLDAETGRLKWAHRLSCTGINTPVPIDKRHILYTTMQGEIGLLKVKE